jgi:thiaminase/transcriptional activator TenA
MTHSLADNLKADFATIWERELYNHPFVVELSKGELPREKYREYLVQNHYYLVEYGRCIGIAATKSSDFETMRQLMKLASTALDSELTRFDKFVIAFGVEKSALESVKPLPQNIAYTSYLFKACSTGTAAQAAAAICPCAWSYVEIGRKIKPALVKYYNISKEDASFYDIYQSPEYEQVIGIIKDVISKGAEKAASIEISQIKRNFEVGSQFERMFWDMAYNSTGSV